MVIIMNSVKIKIIFWSSSRNEKTSANILATRRKGKKRKTFIHIIELKKPQQQQQKTDSTWNDDTFHTTTTTTRSEQIFLSYLIFFLSSFFSKWKPIPFCYFLRKNFQKANFVTQRKHFSSSSWWKKIWRLSEDEWTSNWIQRKKRNQKKIHHQNHMICLFVCLTICLFFLWAFIKKYDQKKKKKNNLTKRKLSSAGISSGNINIVIIFLTWSHDSNQKKMKIDKYNRFVCEFQEKMIFGQFFLQKNTS